MLNKKKGIFLIYVLVAAILISIFLIGAVENMQNSFFLTNKFVGENKAYWAAESGLQYCEYKLKSNICWPFNSTYEGTETFGKFTVNSQYANGGNGYCIHGISDDEDEEFCIYFSKNLSKNKSELIADIVPTTFPSKPNNLSYCSYNSIDEENLDKIFQKNKIKYSQISFKVSKSPEYKAIITTPGIYIISDGRSRSYRTVLEKMLVPDNSNTIGGGIYCGGNILIGNSGNIGIIDPNYRFKISQTSNSRANIYCKKNVEINRKRYINHMGPTPKAKSEVFPFFIGDGTLYLNNSPFIFKINEQSGNQYAFSINPLLSNNGNANNENDTIKQKYGINIEQYKQEFDNAFPKITWGDIQKMKDSDSPDKIEGGTYCAIKSEDDGNNYLFCYLPMTFFDSSYMIDEEKLDTAMEDTANKVQDKTNESIQESTDKIDSLLNNENSYNHSALTGERLGMTDVAIKKKKAILNALRKKLQELEDKYATSGSRIEQFVKANDGEILCGAIKKIKKTETDKFSNSNFSIETVNINTITNITEKTKKEKSNPPEINIKYDTKETPIITIQKSVEVKDNDKGFTLLTLNLQSSPIDINIEGIITAVDHGYPYAPMLPHPTFKYSIAHDVSTDLIFNEKNTGLNEAYILQEINNDEKTGDNNTVQKNNLLACQTVNLYSEGPVVIYGKLSGTGQILSQKSVYFKAGTQLNTSNYINKTSDDKSTEKTNVAETSKIGIYSGKTIKMGTPEGETEENVLELQNKIKYLLAGEHGKSIKEMVNTALYLKNEAKKITVNKNDLGRFATEHSSNSAVNDNLSELAASIAEDWKQPILLSKLMRKYYGFESREAEDYIQEIIERNCTYDETTKQYIMPEKEIDIDIMSRSSSSFSGVLYACGGFKCDAEENNIVINGTIVTYGADPASNSPGSGTGLSLTNADMLNISDYGNIEIYNCKDFSIMYDSTDFSAFVNKISDKPINLSGIYSNKL